MVKTRKAQKQNDKGKETTKTRQRKKQKTKHDDTKEDSNSATNLSQPGSLYFPASAKELLMVDSTRRDSLRVPKNKNLMKTGIADLSRCSNPPKSKEHLRESPQKSVEHLRSIHAIRQLDDLAHQVPQGSNVESPSRYLKQVGKKFRYREIEKGGECVAEEITDELDDIIGRMEKGKEAEKEVLLAEKPADADNELESRECSLSSQQHFIQDLVGVVPARISSLKRPRDTGMTDLSKSRKHSSGTRAIQHDLVYQVPQSSQLESPSRYLKQREPSLRHEEIEKVGSFAAEENLGDGITEFINRPVVEDDEVDSQRCAMDTIKGYRVKPESMAILKKILTRQGDIAKNCTVPIMEFRSELMEMICGIISELRGKDLWQIKEDFLIRKIGLVDGMENLKVDVDWLRVLLKNILEAKKQLGKLKEKKESNKSSIEDAERKLAQCQEQKRELSNLLKSKCDEEIVCKEALAKAKDESTRITQAIKSSISNAKHFLDFSPGDDLV